MNSNRESGSPGPRPPAGTPPPLRRSLSLLEILRHRKYLRPPELAAAVRVLAGSTDRHAAQFGTCPPFNLSGIFLSGPNLEPDNLATADGLQAVFQEDATLMMDETVAGPMRSSEGETRSRFVARLAYELAGGLRRPDGGWTPVATLSQSANLLLKEALQNAEAHPDATSFANAFLAALPREPAAASPGPPDIPQGILPAPEDLSASQTPLENAPSGPPDLPAAGGAGLPAGPLIALAAGLLLAVLVGGTLLVLSSFRQQPPPELPPIRPARPDATPLAAITPAPTPTPAPPPVDPAAPFLEAAEEAKLQDNFPVALENYARALEVSPGRPEIKEEMEKLAARIRSNPPVPGDPGFEPLRAPLEGAGNLGVVSAQIVLAEWLRPMDPAASLRWFVEAARQGQTEAMTQAGLMMASGRGLAAPDLTTAAQWFRQGASAGDSDSMVALAECHLHGKGVDVDEAAAVEMLQSAVALRHDRAMNMLGDLMVRGIPGVIPKNHAEAVKLFTTAGEAGNLDARANLAVMYVNGYGIPKNVRKAVDLWKDGAENHAHPASMYYYGLSLEDGLMGPRNPDGAKYWIRKAARSGNPLAREWCRENRVAY